VRSPLVTPAEGEAGTATRLDRHIQGLRGLAVLLVVAYHSGVGGVGGGGFGVDVFFVVSGFVITRSLLLERARAGRIGLWGFYARRVRRLLPVSALVVLTTLVGMAVLWDPAFRQLLRGPAQAAPVGVINIWSAINTVDYGGPSRFLSPFGHLWSLA